MRTTGGTRAAMVVAGLGGVLGLAQTLTLSREYIRMGGRLIAIDSPTSSVGGPPIISVNPASSRVSQGSGTTPVTGTFAVSAPANLAWTTSWPAHHNWVSALPLTGSGTQSVTFAVSPNTSWDTARATAIEVTAPSVSAHADHLITQYPGGFASNGSGLATQLPYDATGTTVSNFTIDVADLPANEELRNLYVQIGPNGAECFLGVQFGPGIIALYETKWGNHEFGTVGAQQVLNSSRCSLDLGSTSFFYTAGSARLVTKLTRKASMGTGVLDVVVMTITEIDPLNGISEARWRNFVTGFWTLGSTGTAFQPIRVNTGGSRVQDSAGKWWEADTNAYGASWLVSDTIADSAGEQVLYQDKRFMESAWGVLTYQFPAPPSQTYAVTLKFAELSSEKAGERLFHVDINGTRVLTNFDVYSEAGGRRRAVDKTFGVTLGSSQTQIKIDFTAVARSATINGIEIVQATPAGNLALSPAAGSVNFGATRQLSVAPLASGEVASWEVVDPIEANRALGTVSASGLYTAPASATAPQQAIVVAKVNSYPARKGSTTISLTGGGGATAYSAVLAGAGQLKTSLVGDSRFLLSQWRMEARLHNYTFADGAHVVQLNNYRAYFGTSGADQLIRLADETNDCRFIITGMQDLVLRWQRTTAGVRSFAVWRVNGGVLTSVPVSSCWPVPGVNASQADDLRVADFSIGANRWNQAGSRLTGRFAYVRMYDTVVAGTTPSLVVESGPVKLLDYEFDSTDAVLMLNDSGVGAHHLVKDPAGMTVSAAVTP